MKYSYENGNLSINLEEELDMKSCKVLRTIIDGYIMKYHPSFAVELISNHILVLETHYFECVKFFIIFCCRLLTVLFFYDILISKSNCERGIACL